MKRIPRDEDRFWEWMRDRVVAFLADEGYLFPESWLTSEETPNCFKDWLLGVDDEVVAPSGRAVLLKTLTYIAAQVSELPNCIEPCILFSESGEGILLLVGGKRNLLTYRSSAEPGILLGEDIFFADYLELRDYILDIAKRIKKALDGLPAKGGNSNA